MNQLAMPLVILAVVRSQLPLTCTPAAVAAATVYVAQAQELATEYLGQAQDLLSSTLDKLGVKKPAGKTEL
jgi:hypothetical protein